MTVFAWFIGQVFTNGRQDYHITIFHASHPQDPRLHALPRPMTPAATTTTTSGNNSSSSMLTEPPSCGPGAVGVDEDNALLKEEVTITDDAVHAPHLSNLSSSGRSTSSHVGGGGASSGLAVTSVPLTLDTTTSSSSGNSCRRRTMNEEQPNSHAGLAGPCPRYLEEEEALVGEILDGCTPPTLQVSLRQRVRYSEV